MSYLNCKKQQNISFVNCCAYNELLYGKMIQFEVSLDVGHETFITKGAIKIKF